MRVGDYVRTKDGDLFILENIVDNEVIPRGMHLPYAVWKEDIIKSSRNIIDLIEVGDYVNGWKITTIDKRNNKLYSEYDDGYLIKTISKKNIKSIVTKEQFESMEYKVGE